MRIFTALLATILLAMVSLYAPAHAADEVLIEIQLRESPQTLAQTLANELPALPSFKTAAEFYGFADKHRLSAVELKRNIQLTARLKMEIYNKEGARYLQADKLITILENISDTPFDNSYMLMLKGRYLGRSQQDYAGAIKYYLQAIPLIEKSKSNTELLLLYTMQEHLSMMHMIIREPDSALTYLKRLTSIAKQLESDYLLAHAESILGKYFYKQKQLGKSLSHYSEAVKYTQDGNNPSQNAHIELQLARVYRDLESWDEALKSANIAAEAFDRLGNDNYVSSAMTVIAMIYANQELWYQAIDYHLNAQQIEINLGNSIGLALNQHNLGEIYFKIADPENARLNLKRANEIFTSKNAQHYLVYNDLLIAEVAASIKSWQESLEFATKAESIAEAKQLNNELVEALEMKALAQEQLGDFKQAYLTIQKLNSLDNQLAPDSSALAQQQSQVKEQKLKLQLTKVENELLTTSEQLNFAHLASLVCAFFLCLITLLLVKQWRLKNKLNQVNRNLQETRLLEPMTQLPSYLSFKFNFNTPQQSPIKTLALVSLSEQLDYDLSQGYERNANTNQQQLLALKNALNSQAYIIRPGVFLLSFDSIKEATPLLTTIKDILSNIDTPSRLHMGILHLPLLADLAIKLTADQHFSSLQMMLYAAKTLGADKDYYVTMKTLNFASAGIFNKPLYLNIEKSIVRGIVKIETNGNKEDIIWPEWKSHQNINLHSDQLTI
ncbi:hypothetical protein TUM4438_40550 [Shewanella sairae]|uniref:Tetratricopeptide repeat protein n=1 Tax=Shewanella sairae TaxID=190310 RepID=A0ABQ4PQN1_9GAMM|nr:tetratricopeptide repeat protein [Shewanella sairae]MCL1129958.1 tetratricopeptide repeat protein [Shewanella sairae]GIU51326.1 hypothetical protein TUM4438_40550 [Shewanella sairae]